MKSFSMKGVLGTIKRKPTGTPTGPVPDASIDLQGDSPEAVAARSVKAFCESGSPDNTGDEVTFLPPIVEAAESSPAAAAECARMIRKYLKQIYWTKPSYQYNAIMLLRILADNPGMTFTRNMDKKFVEVCKELLRMGRDPSVRQMLMETLDAFEATKAYDEGLTALLEMWKKEKAKAQKAYGGPPMAGARESNLPSFDPHSQNYFSRSHNNKRLPDAIELANRLEEARTSAKLLTQVVQCTPPSEVLSNELIKEFADRCLSASRSVQGYMTSQEPAPDNDTMESMIDTNEQLQQALNLHQRAVLNANKHLGLNERSDTSSPKPPEVNGASRPPPPPARSPREAAGGSGNGSGKGSGSGKGKAADNILVSPVTAGPSRSTNGTPRPAEEDNPFRDPQPDSSRSSSKVRGGGSSSAAAAAEGPGVSDGTEKRLAFEPFHPGFESTPSYVRRQDSALNNVTMRGADAPPPPAKDEGLPRASEENLYDDGDAYDSTPKSKQPMYRY